MLIAVSRIPIGPATSIVEWRRKGGPWRRLTASHDSAARLFNCIARRMVTQRLPRADGPGADHDDVLATARRRRR